MTGSAKVRSTEAIDDFQRALAKFERRAHNALDTLSSEMRRAVSWLEHDCPAHWKNETVRAEDLAHQAELDLKRCLLSPAAGERPACREQRAALKTAQARLEYCREKRERVQHWKRRMQHEQFEYEARLGQLLRILEVELPTARAKLQVIERRLHEYQIERPPDFEGSRPGAAGTSGPTEVRRRAPEETDDTSENSES